MSRYDKTTRGARFVCAVLALGVLAQTQTPADAAANWRIDPARTHIAFAIDSVGYPRTRGQFDQFTGRISVDLDHPDRSNVTFHVQSRSVDVGSTPFDDYLRSAAFLELGALSLDRFRVEFGCEDRRPHGPGDRRPDAARSDAAAQRRRRG